MRPPNAEYILIRAHNSGKDELYSADSLADIRSFLDAKAGAMTDGGEE